MKNYFIVITLFLVTILAPVAQTKQPQQSNATAVVDTAAHSANKAIELLAQEKMQQYKDSLEAVTLKLQIENTAEIKTRLALQEQLAKKQRADSLRHEKLKAQIAISKKGSVGHPVVIAGDTIRIVYTKYGTLSAQERADVSIEKIKDISSLYVPAFDSLTIVNEGLGVEILFRDQIVATVTQSDAIWEDRDAEVMANEIAAATHEAIIKYKKLTSFLSIAKQIGLSLLVILVSFFLIRFINRIFRLKVTRFLIGKIGTWYKGWNFRDYEFMNAKKQVRFTLIAIRVLRLGTSITVVFIALPLLFSIYPITQRFAGVLLDWVLNPIKTIFWSIVDYLPDLFVVVIISFVIRYIIKGGKYITNEIATGKLTIKGFYPDWARSTFNIIRFVIYAFGLVVMFPYLPGSKSDVFKGVSVFIGVLVSIGSSSMITNMVAGLVITYMRPFKVGDHIKIGEITGDVLEKTAYVTRILTYKQEVVTIPNSSILASSVVNYTTMAQERQGIIFHTTVTVGYEIPWRDVHLLLIEAASRSQFILKNPAPFVLQTSLDDFYVSYQLCAYTKHPEKQATVYSQLHLNIQDVFNENHIEIMSPHYRAYRTGSEMVAPKQYSQDSSVEKDKNQSQE